MISEEWQFIRFTAGKAVLSTLLILPVGLVLAWFLARRRWRGKALVIRRNSWCPLFLSSCYK